MVYTDNPTRAIHPPAKPKQLPDLMASLFQYLQQKHEELLTTSFAAHFWFVYVHPFCDANVRTSRILNTSQMHHGSGRKMKHLRPLPSTISYCGSLNDSEKVLNSLVHKGYLTVDTAQEPHIYLLKI